VNDSHDGPGFKKPVGGRVYGPYLQADKFKTRGLAILDRLGMPILYFPAAPGKPNIYLPNGYIGTSNGSQFNYDDNLIFFRQGIETNDVNSIYRIEAMLGDNNSNGSIDASPPYPNTQGETAAATGGFLLWAAGPDGFFGPSSIAQGNTAANYSQNQQGVQKCDDVTNFR
jgi:hypothetical protein